MMFFTKKDGSEDVIKTIAYLKKQNKKLKADIQFAIAQKEIEVLQNKIALNNMRIKKVGGA